MAGGTYTVSYVGIRLKTAHSYQAAVSLIKRDRDWHRRDASKYKVTYTLDIPLSISI